MEKAKKQAGGSITSITSDLFGPKESSKSSGSANGAFGPFFGPSSTGLGKDPSRYGKTGTSRNQDYETHYSNASHGTSDFMEQRNKGKRSGITKKELTSIYQNDRAEPCYNSSIYYGGQDVYSPSNTITSHHLVRKDVEEDDPNGNVASSASRGNWWLGSLYY